MEYWHLDQVTWCSYKNKKLSPFNPFPQREHLATHPLPSEQGLQSVRQEPDTGADLEVWEMEVGKQIWSVPILFPMKTKILVPSQRRAGQKYKLKMI